MLNKLLINKFLCPVFVLTGILSNGYAQDSASIVKNAIKIENTCKLDDNLFNAISGYQLLMVGEGHGTQEPARFVKSITELFLQRGSSVQIGLEIPSSQMKKYLSNPKDTNVYASDFFMNKSFDGRACFAWADLIAHLSNQSGVEFFFYDVNIGDFKSFEERDSLMYLKIKKRIQLHPDWKTITLGGNIHAMLKPYDGKTKTALFLRDDKDLQIGNRILSINHCYASGNYWDNSNQTLQIFQSDHSHSIFATAVQYENYLYIYPKNANMNFSAVYFTRRLTASSLSCQKSQ